MKHRITAFLCGSAIAALVAAAAFPDRPARVAGIDVGRAFASLDEEKAMEATIKAVGERMVAEKDRLSRQLQDLNAELESYKPGSAPYNETLQKVEVAVGAMRAQDQFGQLKLEAEKASAMRELYARIRAAVDAVAKESSIDYVIVNDSMIAIEPAGLQATQQQLNNRRVLFASPEMDITDAVIARANADFKAKGGMVPATPAAPAATPPAKP